MARRAKSRSNKVEELLNSCEVVPEELVAMADRLKERSQPYLMLLADKRQSPRGEDYLRGLLSDLERKSVGSITERLGQYLRPPQYFIGGSDWDHGPLLDELNQQVAQELGEPNGILVGDPSALPKKGKESVGSPVSGAGGWASRTIAKWEFFWATFRTRRASKSRFCAGENLDGILEEAGLASSYDVVLVGLVLPGVGAATLE